MKSPSYHGQGFTLLELLVVLLVIGISIGLVSAIARPSERDLLHLEAQRLAQLLELAAEESRVTGSIIGWSSDGRGYRFWRVSEDGFTTEMRDNDTLRARVLPTGVVIKSLQVEAMAAQGPMRLQFVPYGSQTAFALEMASGTERLAIAAPPIGRLRVIP